jgi:hypothetical protein
MPKILLINRLASGVFRRLIVFLFSYLIITIGLKLIRQLDLVLFVLFSSYRGLTCVFGRENAEKILRDATLVRFA